MEEEDAAAEHAVEHGEDAVDTEWSNWILLRKLNYFNMRFDSSFSIFSITTFKQYMEYFNFRCQIQLDLPVLLRVVSLSHILFSEKHTLNISEWDA